jgi:predicted secreted protein
MSWVTGIAIYVVIWWVVIFAVLPWGVRHDASPSPGTEPGAPANPRLVLKVVATTLVSFVVWLGVYFALREGLIDFRAG